MSIYELLITIYDRKLWCTFDHPRERGHGGCFMYSRKSSFTLLVKYLNGCIEEKGKGKRNTFILIKPRKQSSRSKISGLVILSFDIKLFNTYSIVTEGMPIVIRKNALTFGCKNPRYVLTMVTIKTWNFNGFVIFLNAKNILICILDFLRKFLL